MAYRATSKFVPHFHDNDGNLLSGGTISAFVAGTSTPTTMYISVDGDEGGTQITLNARGEPEVDGDTVIIFEDDSVNYEYLLADADENNFWTVSADNSFAFDSPLILRDATLAEVQLLDDDENGVSIGYRQSTGFLEVAQVVEGEAGDVCVSINPDPSADVELYSPDPMDIRSEGAITLTSGDDFSIDSSGEVAISAANAITLDGDSVAIQGITYPTDAGEDGYFLRSNGTDAAAFAAISAIFSSAGDGKNIIFPNGKVIQWGEVEIGANGNVNVTLAVPCTVQCIQVTIGESGGDSGELVHWGGEAVDEDTINVFTRMDDTLTYYWTVFGET